MPYSLPWLIFVFFIICLFAMPHAPLLDADTGWHIMAGYEMLKTGQFLRHDIFAFTTGNYEWLNMSWLWDVYAALIDSQGGLYLIAALTILIGGLTLVTLAWFCIRRGAGMIAIIVSLLLGFFAFMPTFVARPHQFTNIFILTYMLIFYFFSQACARGKFSLAKYPYIGAVPLIMLLWVNIHGGFFTGFTVIGAYFLSFLLQKQWAGARITFLLGIISTVVVLINPLRIHIIDAALRTLNGPFSSEYILEWEPSSGVGLYLYIIPLSLIFILTFRRHSLAEKIIVVFWILQSLSAIRHLPLLMLVSVPVMADGINYLISKKPAWLKKELEYRRDFSKPIISKIIYTLAIILPLVFLSPVWPKLIHFSPAKSITFPKAEIDYILSNRPQARLFNFYDYGGYVIYESEGKMKTFIDGRAETAFPPELINDYIRFDRAEIGWENMLDKYKIDTVLMKQGIGPQFDYFKNSKEWREVIRGPFAIVYVKNK